MTTEETPISPEEQPQAEQPIAEPSVIEHPSAVDFAAAPEKSVPSWRAQLVSLVVPSLLAVLLFGSGLGTGWLVWGRETPTPAPAEETAGDMEIPEQLTRYDIPVDDDPMLGPADAPITIVEFSDYQCPFCSRWHDEVFGRMMEDYQGQIRFVYRDFPLKSIHPEAVPAAVAANCAGAQDSYWEYHSALFGGEFGLGADSYLQYANKLGLDEASFSACLQDTAQHDEVEADFQFAAELGIQSTPTFFINGIAIVGAQPYSVFKQVIDLELAGKLPK